MAKIGMSWIRLMAVSIVMAFGVLWAGEAMTASSSLQTQHTWSELSGFLAIGAGVIAGTICELRYCNLRLFTYTCLLVFVIIISLIAIAVLGVLNEPQGMGRGFGLFFIFAVSIMLAATSAINLIISVGIVAWLDRDVNKVKNAV